jgi:hypothetical protein
MRHVSTLHFARTLTLPPPLRTRRYVDPRRGDAGFSPHRDRQPDDTPCSFRADGTPMYATVWIPFTGAGYLA